MRNNKKIKKGAKIMSQLKNKLDLNKFAGGTLLEKFNGALKEVVQNLQDPNTSFKNKRGITITIGFNQNEQRDDAKITVAVTTKTAPVLPIETALYMGKDLDTGDIEVREYGKQIAGQLNISDLKEDKLEEETVNEEPTGNNIRKLRDLRAK